MENSFKTLVTSAKSVLVLLPKEPTFDEVASATSIYLALKEQEAKEINVFCPSPMLVEFNKLVGVNKIKQELGNKNLAISFANYNPQGIEKVSWDIDDGTFKLTVVPKVGVTPPNQDQIIVSYAGVAADQIILIGGQDENSFETIKSEDLKDAKLTHIGIHQININGKVIASLAEAASSISEVTANILKRSNYKIEADLATNLLMGIEETTHSFTSELVTADTFSLVAELLRSGGKRSVGRDVAPTFPMSQGMPTSVPSSWTEPKIFKGTSVS
jgi:hypothetical protein